MNIHELLSDLNELLESTNKVPGIRNKVFVDYERLTNFASFKKESMPPFLSTDLKAEFVTFNLMFFFNLLLEKVTFFRFGKNFLLTLLLA